MRRPGCQQENPEGARFCNSCGTRLIAASPAAAPRTYTPAHLAEKILMTSRSAMVGERKQVTVLFADLKGSMELLADRDPEEAHRRAERRREQLDQDLRDWGFAVASGRHG